MTPTPLNSQDRRIAAYLSSLSSHLAPLTTSLSFFLMGILKPFMPSSVGLWGNRYVTTTSTQNGNPAVTFGITSHGAPHEILGWWAIPIGIIGGIAIFALTTFAGRYYLRLSRRSRAALPAEPAFG